MTGLDRFNTRFKSYSDTSRIPGPIGLKVDPTEATRRKCVVIDQPLLSESVCFVEKLSPLGDGGYLPSPDAEDGYALLGDVNFAGPGWSKTFRTRPRNYFDFASKIHDAAYSLNGLSVGLGFNKVFEGEFRPDRSERDQSRKAKADWIFRKMVEKTGSQSFSTTIMWAGASFVFDGESQEEFLRADGFQNPLNDVYFSLLSNSEQYLMIPFDSLPSDEQKDLTRIKTRSERGSYVQPKTEFVEKNYLARTRFDMEMPLGEWCRTQYGPSLWSTLRSISSSTGSLGKPNRTRYQQGGRTQYREIK